MEVTDLISTAARFVNSTNANIFLTGKAGTGKTTFLRDIAEKTHKRFVIVAPTGIAALNAKGVTIHSQFLLPLGTFIPVRDPSGSISESGGIYTQNTLIRKHPINAARKNVLRDIDLLIIDEVSMLRSDILDAIDARMRHAKRNFNKPFGGTQLLMIGDLFQLPPIVRDHEWNVMQAHYRSAWFFDSLALNEAGFVHIELDKIFRQQDETFIRILNHLRNNIATADDIQTLNEHFKSETERAELKEIITLTTHNNRADRMNAESMSRLEGETFSYRATIENDFPASMFPVNETIDLKVGARIMFIKNDTQEGRFYNGKLATVTALKSDKITVRADEEKEDFVVNRMTWENRKYTVDEVSKELEEEVIGSFTQYPIKPAWAITVHKSQGLTFDRAIIDVGRAFAPGQVYVALSRLRSLDGLVLGTRIDPSSISTDREVIAFNQQRQEQPPLHELLNKGQRIFLSELISQTFNYDALEDQLRFFKSNDKGKLEFEDEGMRNAMENIAKLLLDEKDNTLKFRRQLSGLLHNADHEQLKVRLSKGGDYFTEMLWKCLCILLEHAAKVKGLTRTKTYINGLMEIDQLLMKKLQEAQHAAQLCDQILNNAEIKRDAEIERALQTKRKDLLAKIEGEIGKNPVKPGSKTGKRKKKSKDGTSVKKKKGSTYEVTLALVQEGKSLDEIAEKRGMALSTIEGHIARLITDKALEIDAFLQTEEVKEIAIALAQSEKGGIKETVQRLDGNYSFGQVRMVQAVMARFTETK